MFEPYLRKQPDRLSATANRYLSITLIGVKNINSRLRQREGELRVVILQGLAFRNSVLMRTPSELGYRMPAEWHPHTATWLSWPKDPETWPGRVSEVEHTFLQMIEALVPSERVNLLVDDEDTEQSVRFRSTFVGSENIRFHQIQTVDAWIRDYGPTFLVNDTADLSYVDWVFNAWGSKYEDHLKDDAIPSKIGNLLNVPGFVPELVMEGGAIEVNGAGVVLTTEQCLLNPNRNPKLTRTDTESYLKQFLGVEKVLWLGEGVQGDDTDGHIDEIARFTSTTTIIIGVESDPRDENYEASQENFRRLQYMTDARGRPFEIVRLPTPGVISAPSTQSRNLHRLPASYTNFYIANGVVLTPQFGSDNDRPALETIQSVFPKHKAIGINCESLVLGMGSIHCVTQQQPEP